jgi:hypothetical protein
MKVNPAITIIYPKDIIRITRRSERSAIRLLDAIRTSLKKRKHQFITVQEFCNYTGLDVKEVMEEVKI